MDIRAELSEADRRAGCAERKNARLEDEARKTRLWLLDAKTAEGYSDNTSFDVVWANMRAERDTLKRALEGIAEYCSGDDATLGAIARLASIRNTADRALRANDGQQVGDEK